MKKFVISSLVAAGALMVAGCQSEQADTVEDTADAQADAIEEMADEAPTEMQEDALDDKADAVEAQGEADAARVDNGVVAPADTTTMERATPMTPAQ